MPTTTTTYSFNKPVVGADEDDWGGYLNGNWDSVDDLLDGTTPVTGIDINSGTLDGVTIGGTTAGAGTFTTLTATGATTLAGASTSADITFGDNDKAIFGAGSDLQIYHDGAGSYISETGTGNLFIEGADNVVLRSQSTSENFFAGITNAEVRLYYNGAQKFATTSTGIDVTGTVTADGLEFDQVSAGINSTSDGIKQPSTGALQLDARGDVLVNIDTNNNGTATSYFTVAADGSYTNYKLRVNENGDISFYEDTGTTAKFFWDASAEQVQIGSSFGATTTPLLIEGSSYDPTANGGINSGGITIRGGTSALGNNTGALVFTMNKGGASAGSAGISGFQEANNDDQLGLAFFTHGSSTATNPAVERMRIDSSGRLGLGTSSPNAKLEIAGVEYPVARINSSASTGGPAVSFARQGTDQGYIGLQGYSAGTSSNDLFLRAQTGNNMLFFTNGNNERMRIDSSGNVGIGTSSPVRNVSVLGSASATMSFQNSTTGSTLTDGLFIGNDVSLAYFYNYEATPIVFATSATERMRIDSSGNLLVGTTDTDPSNDTSGSGGIALGAASYISLARANATPLLVNRIGTDGENIIIKKDGTTVGSIGNLNANTIYIQGGNSFYGAVLTSPDSGGNGVRLIDNNSNARKFSPSLDNVYDLGDSSERFDDIYATNGTIQTSDQNEKQDIAELSDAEQRVAVAAKGLLRKFRWKDAVAEKGDEARTHFGIIAQDLQAAFEAEGLDAGDYAMFIHSTWTDEETGEERSRMGVRYSELLAFIIAAI